MKALRFKVDILQNPTHCRYLVAKTERPIELCEYSADTRNTNVGEVAAIARRYRFSAHCKKCWAKE
jgi:hypothetical protein